MDNIDLNDDSFITNNLDSSPKIVPAYPNLKSLVGLFFILILYMLIGGLIGGLFLFETRYLDVRSIKPLINLILYVGYLLFAIRYAIRKAKKQEQAPFKIRFTRIPFFLIPVLILTTAAMLVGLEWVSTLLPMPESVRKFFEKSFTKDFSSLIMLVIAAPVLEEIFCRGIVLKGLLKNYTPNKAILISALFFGLIHLNPWQAMTASLSGLFLGWTYYKTQSVIPGMIIHATINGTSALSLFLPVLRQQSFLALLGWPYYILLWGFSIVIFIGGCWIINRNTVSVSD
ncbi:CPBP family intramembrane glutamic endopeptidase [Mucilaginibacter rubeus]|uniref:CPBP family intramembrane metalloprotease n=1 Tax=Mucilaginibacter rubeus TaxID=2027860 RepID=A0A5C1HZG3_9SPHI|nr:type II CAAX endopeptidase family protein [Mucilaginibacter rubeus]QEM11003.1 CPBP family intramembrane metalloprotease [Mucilaginibacter rubeus]